MSSKGSLVRRKLRRAFSWTGRWGVLPLPAFAPRNAVFQSALETHIVSSGIQRSRSTFCDIMEKLGSALCAGSIYSTKGDPVVIPISIHGI